MSHQQSLHPQVSHQQIIHQQLYQQHQQLQRQQQQVQPVQHNGDIHTNPLPTPPADNLPSPVLPSSSTTTALILPHRHAPRKKQREKNMKVPSFSRIGTLISDKTFKATVKSLFLQNGSLLEESPLMRMIFPNGPFESPNFNLQLLSTVWNTLLDCSIAATVILGENGTSFSDGHYLLEGATLLQSDLRECGIAKSRYSAALRQSVVALVERNQKCLTSYSSSGVDGVICLLHLIQNLHWCVMPETPILRDIFKIALRNYKTFLGTYQPQESHLPIESVKIISEEFFRIDVMWAAKSNLLPVLTPSDIQELFDPIGIDHSHFLNLDKAIELDPRTARGASLIPWIMKRHLLFSETKSCNVALPVFVAWFHYLVKIQDKLLLLHYQEMRIRLQVLASIFWVHSIVLARETLDGDLLADLVKISKERVTKAISDYAAFIQYLVENPMSIASADVFIWGESQHAIAKLPRGFHYLKTYVEEAPTEEEREVRLGQIILVNQAFLPSGVYSDYTAAWMQDLDKIVAELQGLPQQPELTRTWKSTFRLFSGDDSDFTFFSMYGTDPLTFFEIQKSKEVQVADMGAVDVDEGNVEKGNPYQTFRLVGLSKPGRKPRTCRRCKKTTCKGHKDISFCPEKPKVPCKNCGGLEECPRGSDGGRHCRFLVLK